MIAMKHFTSCVIFLPGSSISQRSGGATATGCSQAPALSGFKKWESLLMLCVCLCVCVCVRHVCGNRCASFVHYTPLCTRVDKWVTDVSVETDSKWWKMCLQQFSELFSWEQGPFSALEVIALSIKKKQKKEKLIESGTSGKRCVSTQSQARIHGQWSSSELYISVSSQIRISDFFLYPVFLPLFFTSETTAQS